MKGTDIDQSFRYDRNAISAPYPKLPTVIWTNSMHKTVTVAVSVSARPCTF
jgi:hypothetical protein